MAIISVVGRKLGADDLALGMGSYTYTDVNGVQRTTPELNAGSIPLDNLSSVRDAIGWHPVATDLATMVSGASTAQETLYFSPSSYPVTDNLTIPANIELWVPKGAYISVAAGKVLTINGSISAGAYQIFTGAGSVVFGTTTTQSSPEWWYDGGGDWAAALNAAVASLSAGTVRLDAATTISTPILGKSNVNLIGTGSVAPTTQAIASLLNINGKSNIRVSGVTFAGGGAWTSTPFAHPAGGGNAVGFTNDIMGIWAYGATSNIRIDHCTFTGLEHGARLSTVTNSQVANNSFSNLGMSAITLLSCASTDLIGNDINGVHGNITAAGDTSVANSKFADGVLFDSCIRCTQTGGIVQDIKRIGTVFEASTATLNDVITVSGVSYFNMNSCRGTEANAAVWSEGGKSKPSLTVTGCTMSNYGATAGSLYSVGINGTNIIAVGNNIQYFTYGVIAGDQTHLKDNTIKFNKKGVHCTTLTSPTTRASIVGNNISLNEDIGLWIFQCHGNYRVSGNIFRDNGLANTYNSGIYIAAYYADQRIIITGNIFESSASQGDSVGQLYAIRWAAGAGFDPRNVSGNTFIYTGTFSSAYPATLDVAPGALEYGGTVWELMEVNGNVSDKWPVDSRTSVAGYHRFLGFAAAAPIAGAFRQGDYYLNSNPATGQPLGWICTVAGTPGTWKGFGAIL